MKTISEEDKKLAEEAINDGYQEAWENKKLGNDAKHMKKHVPPKDAVLPTSIRLPSQLVEALKKLADEEGLPYQTYLKMILTRHVRGKRKKAS